MKKNRTLFGVSAAILAAGAALALSTSAAEAYVVCNDNGDCWHAAEHYDVPKVHVTFYDDNWDWKAHHDRWHDTDNDGPGYWDTGESKWVTVKQTTTTTTTTTPH